MAVKTLIIDDKPASAHEDETILDVVREAGITLPTLCHLDGLGDVGACRMCMVEVSGVGRPGLRAACVTRVEEGMEIRTDSERLRSHRRMLVELLFAERNHVCAVCVANGHCELQDLAIAVGMDHVRFSYLHPTCTVDISHPRYGIDHNRCVLCTRCVRACDEIEGAHTWDLAGRGVDTRLITDMNQPWSQANTCTSCGKCVAACPTGAIFHKGMTVAEMERDRNVIIRLVQARGRIKRAEGR